MLNRAMIIGRLGQDPELKYTQSGVPLCNLNIATSENYLDRDGNKVERTEWHRVSVFQRVAENCATFLRKGSLVYVEGSINTRKWQDQQGQDRYTTEIRAQRVQFLDRRGGEDGGSGGGSFQGQGGSYQGGQNNQGGYQQGGQGNYNQNAGRNRPQQNNQDDMGSPFPSEASGMDDIPF